MTHIAAHRAVSIWPFGTRSDRGAVSMLFLVNGFLLGSWAPKIPVLAQRLDVSESVLGLLILAFGLGSIATMPIVGGLTARNGSAPVVRVVALAAVPVLLLITLAPDVAAAGLALALFGGMIGGMDVAMNANAVVVEKRMRRAIMSSCHGFWSLGGLIGAGAGGFLIEGMGELGHAVLLTAVALVVTVAVLPHVAQDQPSAATRKATRLRLPASPLPYLIGTMALFCMVPEGAILDWGALYLRQELSADLGLAALGFAAFSGTMAAMRFAGDAIRRRLGAMTTLRVCAVFAIAGMVLSGLAPSAPVAIIGFALAGIGISNMVPIAFSAAGNLPGVAPGIGLSVVTVMGYSGILVAPSAIGFIAEATGFAPIFLALAGLLVVAVGFSSLARYADFQAD